MTALGASDIKYFNVPDFVFENGTRLPSARLAYQDLNPESSKVALIFTCFRGRIKSTLTLADGALRGFRIIVVALFGNGESASPSNTAGFPESIDYRDCVRAQHRLLTEHLGIESVDAVMGFSMAGQCAYHWAVMHPTFMRSAIVICSSARTSRHNYQFLEGPKAALLNSSDYALSRDPARRQVARGGLRAFGKAYSAWLTSAEWFELGLHRELGYESLEAWDEAVTETNYLDWHPDDLLSMLGMWQNGDIGSCHPADSSSVEAALRRIEARVLLMPCQTDQYFRWEASKRELACLEHAVLEVIPSLWGHTAGGGSNTADTEWIDKTASSFLRS